MSITMSSAVSELHTMFPSVDREVIMMILEANHRRLPKTIDELLQMSEEVPEIETKQKNDDDELFARSLQSHLAVTEGTERDDTFLAQEILRIQQDELFARKLQQQENIMDTVMAHQHQYQFSGASYPAEEGPPPGSPSSSDPFDKQIDKKLAELGQEMRSTWNVFSSKMEGLFTSPSKPNVSLQLTQAYEKDVEDKGLLTDDESSSDEESLLIRRGKKDGLSSSSVLKINTE